MQSAGCLQSAVCKIDCSGESSILFFRSSFWCSAACRAAGSTCRACDAWTAKVPFQIDRRSKCVLMTLLCSMSSMRYLDCKSDISGKSSLERRLDDLFFFVCALRHVEPQARHVEHAMPGLHSDFSATSSIELFFPPNCRHLIHCSKMRLPYTFPCICCQCSFLFFSASSPTAVISCLCLHFYIQCGKEVSSFNFVIGVLPSSSFQISCPQNVTAFHPYSPAFRILGYFNPHVQVSGTRFVGDAKRALQILYIYIYI